MMGRLYTVSGPAGVGKGTLVDLACAMDPSLFLSISCTTREVRPGEKDGVNYHYISEARFDQMVREDAFFEWRAYTGTAMARRASRWSGRWRRGGARFWKSTCRAARR